jgi:hypothetical protein
MATLIPIKLIPGTLRASRKRFPTLKLDEHAISDVDYPKSFARSTSFNTFYKTIYLNYHKEKASPSISGIEDELKDSIHPYEDFKALMKPKLKPINSLCPFESVRCRVTKKKDYLIHPKIEYEEYKVESMKMLTNSKFRIEKTKQIINSARYMTNKILRQSINHK